LSKRVSRSDPSRGIVECRYTLLNQRDEVAFTCRSVNLIEMRPRAADTIAPADPITAGGAAGSNAS
jgi:hypothetical protein